jgi:zinc transporter ZupT
LGHGLQGNALMWHALVAVLVARCVVLIVAASAACLMRGPGHGDAVSELFAGLSAGAIAGDALLHLLPETVSALGSVPDLHDPLIFTCGGCVLVLGLSLLAASGARGGGTEEEKGGGDEDGEGGEAEGEETSEEWEGQEDVEEDGKQAEDPSCRQLAMRVGLFGFVAGAHGVLDGLVVGSAFAENMAEGVSTLCAIILHEVVHSLAAARFMVTPAHRLRGLTFHSAASALGNVAGAMVAGAAATAAPQLQAHMVALTLALFAYMVARCAMVARARWSSRIASAGCGKRRAGAATLVGFVLVALIHALEEAVSL